MIGAIVGALVASAIAGLMAGRRADDLEAARDSAVAVTDSLRHEVVRREGISLALLDSLEKVRVKIDTQIIVLRGEVAVSEVETDSSFAALRALVPPELVPVVDGVQAKVVAERRTREELTNKERLRGDTWEAKAAEFEGLWLREKELRISGEGSLAAEVALRKHWEAEAKKMALPNLLGDLPKWAQVAGKTLVCVGTGIGAGFASGAIEGTRIEDGVIISETSFDGGVFAFTTVGCGVGALIL